MDRKKSEESSVRQYSVLFEICTFVVNCVNFYQWKTNCAMGELLFFVYIAMNCEDAEFGIVPLTIWGHFMADNFQGLERFLWFQSRLMYFFLKLLDISEAELFVLVTPGRHLLADCSQFCIFCLQILGIFHSLFVSYLLERYLIIVSQIDSGQF